MKVRPKTSNSKKLNLTWCQDKQQQMIRRYDMYTKNYDTLETRRKKRNWYVLGILQGFAVGYISAEVLQYVNL